MNKHQLRLVFLAGWVCLYGGRVTMVAAESELQKLFRTTVLVQTTREKLQVIPETRQTNGIVVIERAFWGSDDLIGKTFVTSVLTGDPFFRATEPESALIRNGAIWAIDISNPKAPKKVRDCLGSSWPVFTADNADETLYSRRLALAEAMGKVAKAPPEAQATLLRSLALSAAPDISSWSIRAIREADLKEGPEFLKALLGEKLSLESQIELDRGFFKFKAKEWLNNTNRVALFDAWVTTKSTNEMVLKALTYLDELPDDQRPLPAVFRSLLEKGFSNRSFSPRIRSAFLATLARLISPKEEAFRFLMNVIEKDTATPVRTAATYGLINHVPETNANLAEISALKDRILEEDVKERLTAVLKTYADERQERDQKMQPPDAVWEQMKQALLKGDVDAAMQYYSLDKADAYRESFKSMDATELAKTVQQMGPLSRVERASDEATYVFKSKIDDIYISFPVHFRKENGKWKITEY